MPRNKLRKTVRHEPLIHYFKPEIEFSGLSNDYPTVELSMEELEAMRLVHLKETSKKQREAAELMHVSQPTFNRVLEEAHRKVTEALVEGKAIRLVIGQSRIFQYGYGCMDCDHEEFLQIDRNSIPLEPTDTEMEQLVPLSFRVCSNSKCKSEAIYRLLREEFRRESEIV